MKVHQIIHQIKSNPYFREFEKLKNLSPEEYQTKWYKSIKPYGDDYTENLHDHVIRNLNRLIPAYNKAVKIDFGYYSFTCKVQISTPTYLYDKATIKARIIISTDQRVAQEYYCEDWHIMELHGDENLSNIEPEIRKHLSKYFYESGVLGWEQFTAARSKESTLGLVKLLIKQKAYLNFGATSEDKTRSWIKKHFNIDSHVSLKNTVRLANELGKQKETLKVYAFDTSFMDYFDGDIGELENEFYEANPIEENIIYI